MPFKRVIMDPTRSVPPPTARDGCRSCTRNLLPKSRDRSRPDAASTSRTPHTRLSLLTDESDQIAISCSVRCSARDPAASGTSARTARTGHSTSKNLTTTIPTLGRPVRSAFGLTRLVKATTRNPPTRSRRLRSSRSCRKPAPPPLWPSSASFHPATPSSPPLSPPPCASDRLLRAHRPRP